MTKGELVEALANAMHSRAVECPSTAGMECVNCRLNAEAAAPAVVGFMAKWLAENPNYDGSMDLERRWREDMAS